MKIAIMQPYFLPYLGYWQLASSVDYFVIYDNVEYTKKGWINRNRILVNGSDCYITLPLQKDSDHLPINRRALVNEFFEKDAPALIRRIDASYRKCRFASEGTDLLRKCFSFKKLNLFEFLYHSIRTTADTLQITTPFVISSELEFDQQLRGQERVIAICKALGGNHYINPPGGRNLYESNIFSESNIKLSFLLPQISPYAQLSNTNFVEHLSIVDVILNIGIEHTIKKLNEFRLG